MDANPTCVGAVSAATPTLSNDGTTAAAGVLYVVATPIGNLGDFTPRAREILASVTAIAAEDTRHSKKLLQANGIQTSLFALHEHNESAKAASVIARLSAGDSIALISDAGTPLISDPGFPLIRMAQASGITVSPIPGASALIAALSVAGIATDRFCFEGFLAAKPGNRRNQLQALYSEHRTLVFYEAPHRIAAMLTDLTAVLGAERRACVARELTKRFEEVAHGSLAELQQQFADNGRCRGEFVVVVAGNSAQQDTAQPIAAAVLLSKLCAHLPVKTAAKITAELTGESRNALYQQALELRASNTDS